MGGGNSGPGAGRGEGRGAGRGDSGSASRRRFLSRLGGGAVAGPLAAWLAGGSRAGAGEPRGSGQEGRPRDGEAGADGAAPDGAAPDEPARKRRVIPPEGTVARRKLGRTGLEVSEVGFGGHSWAYKQVPDGKGGLRRVTVDEAERMITSALEMGVNFFDACTPTQEHTVPGEVIDRLKARERIVISARCCHRMKGVKADRAEISRFVDERLRMWRTDRFELLMLSNTENDTRNSGYWDMSYSIEEVERLKKEGKILFAGFGSHFTPEIFLRAFEEHGPHFDVCSMPYNVRHRAAEKLLPEARKAGLGVVTIKPFARRSLLKRRDLAGADAHLPRDMVAFVLENTLVDCCISGCHTDSQMREDFSASWTGLTPGARERLDELADGAPCLEHAWLETGWRHA